MTARRVHLLALLAYLLLTLAATHPLWLHLTTAVPSDIGDPLLNTWILAWDGHALLTDPSGLFNANMFFPLPNTLAYSEHLLGSALPALPVLLLGNEPVLAYNLSFLFGFALCGWSAYLLFRRHTGHGWAAFIAGAVFAFAPYRFAAYSHLQLLTFQWLPFCLLALDSLLAKPSDAVWVAFVVLLSLQIATSWHLAVFSLVIVAVYLAGRLAARRSARLPHLALAAVALVAAGALVWPLVTPYLSALRELQVSRPSHLAAEFSARLPDYLAAPPINRLFGALTAPLSGRPLFTEENFLFPGVIAPALAVIGLVRALRHRRSRSSRLTTAVWAVLLALALVLTLGPLWTAGGLRIPLPYAWLATLSPVFGLIRVPPRWMIAALLPLAGLAAWGAVAVLGGGRRQAPLALLFTAGLLLEGWSVPLPLAEVGSLAQLPPVYRWLAAQPGNFGILEWPLHVAPRPEYPETRRLYASTLHWKRLVNGYSGLTPARQTELDRSLAGFPDRRALETLGSLAGQRVRYLVVHSLDQGLDRARWEGTDRWVLDRSAVTRPVWEGQGDFVYELSASPDVAPAGVVQVEGGPWPGGLRLVALQADLESGAIDLYWRAGPDGSPPRDATVFVHLLDPAGNVLAQGDGPPVAGHYPLTAWQPGELVRDRHALVSTAGSTLTDGATLRIGLYYPDTMQRVPIAVAGPDRAESGVDHVLLDLPAQPAQGAR